MYTSQCKCPAIEQYMYITMFFCRCISNKYYFLSFKSLLLLILLNDILCSYCYFCDRGHIMVLKLRAYKRKQIYYQFTLIHSRYKIYLFVHIRLQNCKI